MIGIWASKARSSGAIVKGQSVCGVETKTASSKQDQTLVVQPVVSRTHWLPYPGRALWVVRPLPRNLFWAELRWRVKLEVLPEEKEGFSHLKITGGSSGLPMIYCFHIV